jgi:hypothetical protein
VPASPEPPARSPSGNLLLDSLKRIDAVTSEADLNVTMMDIIQGMPDRTNEQEQALQSACDMKRKQLREAIKTLDPKYEWDGQ